MADFPTTLPAPLLSGYSGEADKAFIRTDMDAGPARQRKRFTTTPYHIDISWRFKSAEMVIFREFHKTDINRGTDWFNMTLDIGDGFATYVVRFTKSCRDDRISNNTWQVSSSIEVQDA